MKSGELTTGVRESIRTEAYKDARAFVDEFKTVLNNRATDWAYEAWANSASFARLRSEGWHMSDLAEFGNVYAEWIALETKRLMKASRRT